MTMKQSMFRAVSVFAVHRKLTIFVLLYLVLPSAYAERVFVDILHNGNSVELSLSDAKLTITAINEGSVEVLYEVSAKPSLPSFALPDNHVGSLPAELRRVSAGYEFVLPSLTVTINTSPFYLSFSNETGVLASEEIGLFSHATMRGFRFRLDKDEELLGGGQRVLGMDRRGHRLPLYNKAHYGYTTESTQMYFSLPAVMSSKPYIIAFDNSANGFLDIGHSEPNILQFEADAGRTAYIFSAGKNHKQLIEYFVSATGKQPLPPRWALGNYASRFGYKTQQEVLATIDKFIEQDFPVDAVVLDLYWFGADIKGHMGNLQWDKKNWPNPEQMIDVLSKKGVNTVVITEPFILSTSSQWDSAVLNKALATNLAGSPRQFDFYFGNTGLVDVFSSQAQNWFWQYYQKLNDQGVMGWWGDLGEPEVHPSDTLHQFGKRQVSADEIHNVYGHKWAQMLYEKQREASPNRRPFIMMRAGFLGSQRYGMIPWTGDVDRSWGGLQPQVELALQMSVFGLAYIHSDLGGFAGAESFDAELYTRWLQYGAFQPVYRPHGQDHIAPEPVFHDQVTQDIVREYVKLRYRLLPYNYSLSINNSLTGMPLMRPLFVDFPEQAITRTDAYMWGDAFLVAPVVEPGQTEKDVLLPKGIWFDYWQHTKMEGGKMHRLKAPLSTLPVLVKAGSFIPSVDDMQNTKAYSSESLNVAYYTDISVNQSDYLMYEDDGNNPNSIKDKQIQTIHFTSSQQVVDNKPSLKVVASVTGHYTTAPSQRELLLHIIGLEAQPETVMLNGETLAMVTTKEAFDQGKGAFYEQLTKILFVKGTLTDTMMVDIR